MKWGAERERKVLNTLFGMADEFRKTTNRPVWMGEFGTNVAAGSAERAKWAAYVRSQAEAHGMPWAYWSLCSKGYGMYDQEAGR